MSHFYLDSSAIAKRYLTEVGSTWVKNIADPVADNLIILAEITHVEVAAAIAAKHRAPNGISLSMRDRIVNLLALHCDTEYELITISKAIMDRAIDLTQNHRLRGYDAIQLATALDVNASLNSAGLSGLRFVAADKDLLAAAQATGLLTDDPNTHL